MTNAGERKSIVILGAGFGGLHCCRVIAQQIKKLGLQSGYRVLLVDHNDYHTYTPTLYEAVTTAENLADQLDLKSIITLPIKDSIADLPVDFARTKIIDVDMARGDIRTETGTAIEFEYLVLALGSTANYFNIPGLQHYALPMKTFADALHIREKILMSVTDPEKKACEIVIGGGGSAGVELAGEIKLWCARLKNMNVNVTIVEGGPTVLSASHPRIIKKAQRRLEKLGVRVWANERLVAAVDRSVKLKSGKELPYDILIWTGGVMGNPVMAPTGACLPVGETLKLKGGIYALGDGICVTDPKTGKRSVMVARAAIKQADIVSHNIIEEVKAAQRLISHPDLKPYKIVEYPYVIPVGGKYAIAKIGPFVISGFLAWVFKGLIEITYLASVLPLHRALAMWARGMWIFLRNDHLG